jgi:hypothetical protein
MNSSYVEASYGNKKFLVSVLTALDQLRADDFVQLYLQAKDPSVYKHKPEEGDAHTKLLAEIAANHRQCKIESERGAIILQAIYATPSITNASKALAMLMVGATLEYDDFVTRFGSGGDLAPHMLDPKDFSIWNSLHHALTAGVAQSDDVRFVIEKAKLGEKLYGYNAFNEKLHSPFLFNGGFKFSQESFEQFFDAVPETEIDQMLKYAPKGFYASDYFAAKLDSGFAPNPWIIRHCAISDVYKEGRLDTFEKLLPQLFIASDAHNIGQSSDLRALFFLPEGTEVTAEQTQMQNSFRGALKAYTSEMIAGDKSTSLYNRYKFIRDALMSAFIADNYDEFSRVLKEAVVAHPVTSSKDIFDGLYGDVAKLAQNDIENHGATKNLKAMLTLVKDMMVVRMNEAVDLVNQLPEVTPKPQEKNDRGFRGFKPQFDHDFAHGPGH